MKTPIEQLEVNLHQWEQEIKSYEESIIKATADIAGLNKYIAIVSGYVKTQKEAITKLQYKKPHVLNIYGVLPKDTYDNLLGVK